jgi:type III pantothenate kinase
MWLAIDIGNSGLKGGWFDRGRLTEVFRIDRPGTGHENRYRELLRNRLKERPVERVGVISVVPEATTAVLEMFEQEEIPFEVLQTQRPAPITMGYKTPETLGIDRLAAAAGGYLEYGTRNGSPHPVIAIDAGTAITYEVIDQTGKYLGGMISPGLKLLQNSLAEQTAQLPTVPIELPQHPIGQTTTAAMQAGLIYSCIDGITGAIRRLACAIEPTPVVVMTGGWTELLSPHISAVDHIDPDLVLKGIYALMNYEEG